MPAQPPAPAPGAPAVASAPPSAAVASAAAPGTPPAAAAPASAIEGNAARIGFAPGSAVLSPDDAATVKQFAGKRGTSVVSVTGYGDAAGNDVASQTAALSLGLSRAQAIANALTTDGVPQSAVRVGAEAAGRGARLNLLQ
jgi:outer membrane protein OmpA-like peptidoglycan-associated protein